MRVALLCLDPGVPLGGPKGCSVHLRATAGALLRAGHEVTAYVRSLGPPDDAVGGLVQRGLQCHDVPADATPDHLQQLWKARRPELVLERLALFECDGVRAASALGIRHIYEVNAPLDEEAVAHRGLTEAHAARASFAAGFACSQGAIAVSREVEQWVCGLAPSGFPTRVIENGADPSFLIEPDADSVSEASRSLGTGSGFRIGFIGSFRPWHDLETLTGAAELLRGQHPVRLVLVGSGPCLESTVAQAAERCVPVDSVGSVPHAMIPAFLSLCDAVVIPYRRADLYFSPLKLLEAMAAGRPIVATATGPCRRFLRDGVDALLVPPSDSKALAAALRRLIENPNLAKSLGLEARETVRRSHLWDHVVEEILRFVQRVPEHTETR